MITFFQSLAFRSLNLFFLSFLIFHILSVAPLPAQAPACDLDAIHAKYWQYKERFNDHFICRDRDETLGCVHDGIGFTQEPSDDTDSDICNFEKSGMSLPVSGIYMRPDGLDGINSRNPNGTNTFGDIDCSGETSNDLPTDDPNHKYNYAEIGSETLTHMGWYLTTLATEYELLGKSGQTQKQQETLEDIFLALQAINRLDMQAKCLLKEMYDDRVANGGKLCSDANPDYIEGANKGFDVYVNPSCVYQPDYEKFSGFMLREDATQDLEDCLHDPSSDDWNVDAISSVYAESTNTLTNCTEVDRFCFHSAKQNFLSQDQIINLLYGLSFVKKFIPPTATVTTCEGESFNVLSMAQDIATGIVLSSQSNNYGQVIWSMVG